MTTTRNKLLGLVLVSVLGVLAPFAACTYSPDLKSGDLQCSMAGECPRGFSCARASNRCVSAGVTPTGSGGGSGLPDGGTVGTPSDARLDFRVDVIPAGTGGTIGMPGTGGTSVPTGTTAADYVGTWTFGSLASVYTDCGTTGSGSTSLAGSTLTISRGTGGPNTLLGSWSTWPDCTYDLDWDAYGIHVFDTLAWGCTDTSSDPTQEWLLESFDVVTEDGVSAIHGATYLRGDFYLSGDQVFCDQTVHAAMTKN